MLGIYALLLARSSGVALAPAPPTRPILGAGGRLVPLAALAVQPVAGPRLNGGHPVALNSPRLNSPQMRGPSGLGGGATVVRVARSLRANAPPPSGTPPIKTIVGTGASTVGGLVSSGTGAEIITGTGASVVGGLVSSGTGAEVFQGTGASRVGGIVSSGTGADVISGTGASRVGGVLSSGSGTSAGSTVTGSGASRLLPVRSSGVGGLAIVGTGASVLGGLVSYGYGLGIWYVPMVSISATQLVSATIDAGATGSRLIVTQLVNASITCQGTAPMKVGDAEQFTCLVTDLNGNPAAPGSVSATVRDPSGAITTLSVTSPATGTFLASFQWAVTGIHTVRFTGTAPYPFVQEQQYVILGLAY